MTTTPPAPTTLHPGPAIGWLNDPNGVVRWQGRWHVFFQHNPEGPVHHRIHWGHLSTADLVTWHEHPVAFGPTPDGPDAFGCWSGVFVTGLDRAAVVYSGVVDETCESTVCLRYALDGDLESWTGPVVVARTPTDTGVRVMRDPYVFTHAGRRWALLGAGLDDGRPAVLLYSCDNLEAWDFEQIWLTPDEPTVLAIPRADIWECPQLVTLGQEAVLVVSLQLDGAFGPVLGVRGVLETSPNGQPALTTTGAVERLDLGEDFYAPQVVPDEGDDQRPLLFGWVRQEGVDDGSSEVAGCLTFPRRLGIEDGRLVSVLDPAVDRLAARAAEAAGGADVVTGPARVGLARAVRVVPSGAAVVLHGRAAAISLEAGGSAWVDGEVLEVFPADAGTPTTLRDHGTSSWQVEVPEGGRVRIEQLAQPTP